MTKPTQDLHPNSERLVAFSAGRLPLSEAAVIETHIADCEPCCETLMELSTDDTFVELLKNSRDPVGGPTLGLDKLNRGTDAGSAEAALAGHPRYEIVAQIAKGGMGEVFKAKHRMMDRIVAIKVINNELMRNPDAVERFHREVKTAAHLSHPNVVTAYDAEQAEGVHFLAMEYVDGINLADLVNQSGSLSIGNACDYVRQVAVGLQYAHEQGLVHRDMKPHNLMLTADGTVKILDFGLASLVSRSVPHGELEPAKHADLTSIGSIMGTPNFISPEQATDARQADIRSDIYSLGATLYYLLSGRPPFDEASVVDTIRSHAEAEPLSICNLRDDAPQELSAIISKMMVKDPGQRLQTPQEVADALAPFAVGHRSDSDTSPKRKTDVGRSRQPPKKMIAMASAGFGLLLAGIIFLQTDKGTVAIESVDDSVDVTISKSIDKAGGEYLKLSVVDKVTGSRVVRLPSGQYKVSLGDKESKYQLDQGGFTLRRGGEVVIKVTRKEGVPPEPQPPIPLKLPIPSSVMTTMMTQAAKLSSEEVAERQSKADADPDDFLSRLQLLGYYSRHSILKRELREDHTKLLSWLVRNHPESAGRSQTNIHASINPHGYVKVKDLWMKNVKNHPRNIDILRNAASYFLQSDRPIAEDLLKQAQVIEPKNVEIAEQLGQLYRLGLMRVPGERRQKNASLALAQFELAMSQNEVPQKTSSLLIMAAKVAFAAGEKEKAKKYADRLLSSGENGSSDWNAGNVVHQGNLILGRLALQVGDVGKARDYLLSAGKTSGSPTLKTSGPNMSLAKELLEKGEQGVVLEFFGLCGKFWKNEKLKQWTITVKNGGIPEFGANLVY